MVPTRYSVGLHILLLLADGAVADTTSGRMAGSIGTNPVVVRRIAGLLVRGGLVRVQRGPGGAALARPATAITLADVWRAIHGGGQPLLRVHGGGPKTDATGRRITAMLRDRFDVAEQAMLADLRGTTLAELAASLHARTSAEPKT
jgi:DNA-binding IscR family transcriptional regulator